MLQPFLLQHHGSGHTSTRLHIGGRHRGAAVQLLQLFIQPRSTVQTHKGIQRGVEVQINVEDPVGYLGHLLRDAEQLIRQVDAALVDQLKD